MLVRDIKRVALVVGPLMVFLLLALGYWDRAQPEPIEDQLSEWFWNKLSQDGQPQDGQAPKLTSPDAGSASPPPPPPPPPPQSPVLNSGSIAETHHEIFSVSTRDKKFFEIYFGEEKALNPNILPHPVLADTWVIVAQRNMTDPNSPAFFTEIGCKATFSRGALRCIEHPNILTIAATFTDKCQGEYAIVGLNIGPHDARVFYGPSNPYIMYGSNSGYTCFGQWLQDFRVVTQWGLDQYEKDNFRSGTEIMRPPPVSQLEKNFFLFWDQDNNTYVHHDTSPKRVFAKLNPDGSVGSDLAPHAAHSDEQCMQKLMPKLVQGRPQSIHQATNSLAITMCNRADPQCKPTTSNTFLFHIFQFKTFENYHSAYEPYVMMFNQHAPFEVTGISSKPLWIHGRTRVTDMFYVVSMSWKTKGHKYHGYLDDVLFVAFGVEDHRTAGIDVLASDLLANMGSCNGA